MNAARLMGVWIVIAALAPPAAGQQDSDGAAVTRPAEGLLFVGPADNAPWSYRDPNGRPTGYDVEAMALIAERLGEPIKVELLADDPNGSGLTGAQRARQAALDGHADGVIGMGAAGPDQLELRQWRLCGPTHPMRYGVAVLHDDESTTSLQDLSGTRIAAVEGDPIQQRLQNNNELAVMGVSSVRLGCLYLSDRRVRGLVAVADAIRHEASRPPAVELRFIEESLAFGLEDYGPALPAEAEAALADRIEQAVEQLNQDGSLEALRRRWFSQRLQQLSFYQQPWFDVTVAAVVVAIPLIVLLVLWRRSIHKAVARRTRKLRGELEVLRKQYAELAHRDEHPARKPGEAVELPPAPTQLRAIALPELLESLKEAAAGEIGRDTEIVYKLDPSVPPAVAHEPRLRTAVLALVENAGHALRRRAAEADEDYQPRLTLSVRPAGEQDLPPDRQGQAHRFVALSVRDNGVGVERSLHQKIFEPGYTTRDSAGGQGLPRVYSTVAEVGGWIDLTSAPGRGAEFTLFLPAAEAEPADADAP